VACCPGPTENGSELICVKLLPTGSAGGGGGVTREEEEGEESDEHPFIMVIMQKHKTTADMADTQRIVPTNLRKHSRVGSELGNVSQR